MKYFGNSKKMNNFAVLIIFKSGLIRLIFATGFFKACTLQYIGSVPPRGVVNAPTALEVISSGKGRAVFSSVQIIHFFQRNMLITEKNARFPKRSKKSDTSAHDTCAPVYQVVYQTIIPEKPEGLIGRKVVFKDRFYKHFPYTKRAESYYFK